MEPLSVLSSLVSLLPELAVTGVCVYYFSQRQSVDGLLLSIGSGAGFLLSLFFRLMPLINIEAYQEVTSGSLFLVTGVIGFLSSGCFALGLGLLIKQQLGSK